MRLVLIVLVVAGLLGVDADAATRDLDYTAALSQTAPGQYKLTVANTGTTVIQSVALAAGPALKVSSMTTMSSGTCATTSSGLACSVALQPPPCPCNAGEQLELTFAGSGDPGGSVVTVDNSKSTTLGVAPTAPPPTTQPPTTKPPAAKPPTAKPAPKKKRIPKCRKGQRSTKRHPCHR